MSAEIKAPKYPILDEIEVPAKVIENWQVTIDLLAEIAGIPAALIMRVHTREIEVFLSSHSPGNVYHHGEKAPLDTGLYCETVMSTQRKLVVPDALKDPDWNDNPDIKLGMISYCGLPLTWPNGELYGTICILDKKENAFTQQTHHLIDRFRDSIQLSLANIYDASKELWASEESYRILFREMQNGFAHSEIICDAQGRPINSRYLAVNPAFERITGRKAEEVVGKTILEVFPALEPRWIETFGRVALTGEPAHFENHAAELGITFDMSAFRPAPNQYACTFTDITERKRAEEAMRQQS
ncbi:MAG: PAS domain S-box protein [Candidatus Aminicenantes bacterium]|nr:PAS domain S-box protein [Candidatus Aminicenantes bacterium]